MHFHHQPPTILLQKTKSPAIFLLLLSSKKNCAHFGSYFKILTIKTQKKWPIWKEIPFVIAILPATISIQHSQFLNTYIIVKGSLWRHEVELHVKPILSSRIWFKRSIIDSSVAPSPPTHLTHPQPMALNFFTTHWTDQKSKISKFKLSKSELLLLRQST